VIDEGLHSLFRVEGFPGFGARDGNGEGSYGVELRNTASSGSTLLTQSRKPVKNTSDKSCEKFH